jgi:hypothetical protein
MADTAKNFDIAEIIQKINYPSIPEAINQVFQSTSLGEIDSAIGNSFHGFNHRQTATVVPINKDSYGLTFFTRPRFNLTTENLNNSRQLTPLLTTQEASIQRAIRCSFDRELVKRGIRCPFIDNQQAFIPLLTNHLVSMNGWPDLRVDTFTAQEGAYKQTWAMVDSVAQDYSAYDITADFRNMPGSPITLLFFTWIHYMSLIYQGILVPYFEQIIENEIDYQTRIYRLVLDVTKTKVQGISACGAAMPLSAPMGAKFNFAADRPLNNAFDTISVNFRAIGAMYEDTILYSEFNRTVQLFNDTMKNAYRSKMYTKVDMEFLEIFNNRGYPYINPDTSDLEWWVPNDIYQQRLGVYLDQKKRRAT